MQNDIKTLLGGTTGGMLIAADDALVLGNWVAIVVNADAIFQVLDINGVSVLSSMGLAGRTVTAGMYLGSGFNYTDGQRATFTAIRVSSGSVIAY